jgi:asparagine synthase (glutamine-hydrolysing)
MCGIYGKINYKDKNSISLDELKKPLSLMVHRGPDDEGIFIDRYIGLSMRRLKVIDLEGGHQPIFNETGDKVIVYNGEIYNYIELRKELTAQGHVFKTNSDTEVILHLYEQYGIDCLTKLNGMFAFAIWDKKKEELIIARDRLGIKPLFYSISGNSLIFSSEIKAILSNNSISKQMDREAFANYFSFYYVSSPLTMFKEIKRLPPAHCLIIKNSGFKIQRYWDYEFKPEITSESNAIEQIQTVLLDSVKRQIRSDVPLGVFLSSGLDSASIVAMMHKLSLKINTYTIGYDNSDGFNELNEARLIAKKYNTNHSECILKPSLMQDYMPSITEHLAEPHGDWTQAALFHLSKESRKDSTVVLSGAGGDELFAGYPTLTAAKIAAYYKIIPSFIRKLIKAGVFKLPVSYDRLSFDFKAKSFVSGAELEPELAHMRYKEIFSQIERDSLFRTKSKHDPFSVFKQYFGNTKQEKMLNKLLYLDLNVFLPDCVLHSSDITTMMNSQECRVPLLDNAMIELSQKIPIELKINGFTTKYILRKALAEYLPEEIIKMPKKGLSIPLSYWIKDELKPFIHDVISDAEKRNKDTFDFKYVNELFSQHVSGKRDNTRKISCLVSYFLWQKLYQ